MSKNNLDQMVSAALVLQKIVKNFQKRKAARTKRMLALGKERSRVRIKSLLAKANALKFEELFEAEELTFDQIAIMGPAELKLMGIPLGVGARIVKAYGGLVELEDAKAEMQSRQVEGGLM